MVPLIAATAYLIGLAPALLLAASLWLAGVTRGALAEEQRRRVERFRDCWSYRFHRDLFAPPARTSSNGFCCVIKTNKII
jgi:hypothetical protein